MLTVAERDFYEAVTYSIRTMAEEMRKQTEEMKKQTELLEKLNNKLEDGLEDVKNAIYK